MARAQKYTSLSKQITYYSDFMNNFNLNPDTGNLAVMTNADAIKNSIRNLVMTNMFERPYQPFVGSKIHSLLFDLNDTTTHDLLVKTIQDTITNFEPRALAVSVKVLGLLEDNSVSIQIAFKMLNIPTIQSFELILKRIR